MLVDRQLSGPSTRYSDIFVAFDVWKVQECRREIQPIRWSNARAPAPMIPTIAECRLRRQILNAAPLRRPEDVVAWFGAVQAQEYEHAKWALGLRARDGTVVRDVERAFDDGRILRTHVMRPTWHFVTPADIHWLLQLTAPCVHKRMAPYDRQLELDARTMTRAARVFERALRDGRFLTRAELGEYLHAAGLRMTAMQLAHVAMHAELEGVICSGPRKGKQFTYALLAERTRAAGGLDRRERPDRDEALATLARRFFRSHGPATLRDFSWWSGLAAVDVRRAAEIVKPERQIVDARVYWTFDRDPRRTSREAIAHLLPIYDEYLIAYRDRDAVPHGLSTIGGTRRFATFQHALVIDGQVAGTWRPLRGATNVMVDVLPQRRLTRGDRIALADAGRRYERFLGKPVTLSVKDHR